MTVQSRALQMQHDVDPAQEILDAVRADVEQFTLTGRDILCVVYERGEKLKAITRHDGTKTSLIVPETANARQEDRFQGIVCLVVKVGPCAEESSDRFEGYLLPKVGDWVIAPIGSCMSLLMGERTCRLIEAQMIRGIIKRPDMVA